MDHLNYKHLHYFWMVAKTGSIAAAGKQLHLTPQTISMQLGQLEKQLGRKLFERAGRGLRLTESGRVVLGYAEEIFSLGGELLETVRNFHEERILPFKVGIVDVVPKSIAYRLLDPAMQLDEPLRIHCREGALTSLLAELAVHQLDLVLADSPIPAGLNVRGFNHPLGECGLGFFATETLAQRLDGPFPGNLERAPMLLPSEATAARGRLIRWFERLRVRPRIVGEFDDSALMKAFGRAGRGVFVAPTPIAREVEKQYGVIEIGATDEIRDPFYAITTERRITHPAVAAITRTARGWLR